jgi:hypothetical protein
MKKYKRNSHNNNNNNNNQRYIDLDFKIFCFIFVAALKILSSSSFYFPSALFMISSICEHMYICIFNVIT